MRFGANDYRKMDVLSPWSLTRARVLAVRVECRFADVCVCVTISV